METGKKLDESTTIIAADKPVYCAVHMSEKIIILNSQALSK